MDVHEIPLLLISDANTGASNVSNDGSSFDVFLEDPILIPNNATSCTVEVQGSTIWWVMPNIITAVNDAFTLDDGISTYNITVPQGLYDLTTLGASVDSALVAAGAATGLFTFIADSSTQKVVIRINQVGVSIDFTVANTFRVILGFNSVVLGPTVVAQTDFLANNQAAFNQIDYFLIHCDLVDKGIRNNDSYWQTVAQIPIDVNPGSQIINNPQNPTKSPADHLIGGRKVRIRMWLTDQNNEVVNTNSETWSARIVIRYTHE